MTQAAPKPAASALGQRTRGKSPDIKGVFRDQDRLLPFEFGRSYQPNGGYRGAPSPSTREQYSKVKWRFSGGTSGLSIGHVSPEAAEGGTIALVQDGDRIEIDIEKRSITLAVSDVELDHCRAAKQAAAGDVWKPIERIRKVSAALKAYAAFTTSASRGAVRDLDRRK